MNEIDKLHRAVLEKSDALTDRYLAQFFRHNRGLDSSLTTGSSTMEINQPESSIGCWLGHKSSQM